MGYAKLLLRLGLAFVFLYASIASFLEPNDWIWYIPEWIRNFSPVSDELLLFPHSAFELLLALWLLSGRWIFYAAVLAALDLFVITIVNYQIMNVVFRDVGLVFMALALASLYRTKSAKPEK